MHSVIPTPCRLVWDEPTVHGLTQAVADLHSAGIVHAGVLVHHFYRQVVLNLPLDLHLGKIGYAANRRSRPGTRYAAGTTISPSFYLYFPPREIPPHLLISSLRVIRSLPTIRTSLVPKLSLGQYYLISEMVSLRFADAHRFLIISSAAHEAGTLPLSFECAVVACAPEVAFARFVEGVDNPPIEPPADVWALGTIVRPSSSLFFSP